MKVKIKKLVENAVIPSYAKDGDAGMDLTAVSREWDCDNAVWSYGTGLSFEIPKGYVGLIFPRSSIFKQDLCLSNSIGVIDSGYRGEVLLKFKELGNHNNEEYVIYNVGDRVGQIVILPYPQIEFEEVSDLSESERGTGGYGSTNLIPDEAGQWSRNTTKDEDWSNAVWVNGDTTVNTPAGTLWTSENAFGISQENYTNTGGVEYDNKNDSLGINHFTNTVRSKNHPDEEV